jgi:hypothetical protein
MRMIYAIKVDRANGTQDYNADEGEFRLMNASDTHKPFIVQTHPRT